MVRKLRNIYKNYVIKKLKAAGMQIADDCQVLGNPNSFGSEPWLVSIGKGVTITAGVRFITHDGATRVIRNNPRYANVKKFGRITIHDNCFIGMESVLMPGISIGPNSIVAAGAVVVKDVPPGEVHGGVPAKKICTTEEYAEKILETMPDYNLAAYKQDKKAELLRLFPYPW
jgi:acetyltransferase-like isoleucine patch superfamily enzyme